MSYSAFNLSSSIGADGRSIRAIKEQVDHGFSAGSVVRCVQNAAGDTADFQLAQADSVVNAEGVGIVESVNGNQFTVVYQGEINTALMWHGDPGAFADLSLSDVWFLDASVSGGLTAYAPLGAGNVVKPMLTMLSGTNDDIGLVTNYVGTVVGGENTVSLDSVHPVGEVVPWAGTTGNIPSGWKLCDGATVDTGAYPDYYNRVGTKFGYWASCDLTFVASTSVTAEMLPGNTAYQSLGESNPTNSSIISYTENNTVSGTLLVDPDYLIDRFLPGGETSGEIAPHGLVFTTGTDNLVIEQNSKTVSVDALTIIAAKTPDLRARHIITATDGFGTFDGYTAGQIGGLEDAATAVVASHSSLEEVLEEDFTPTRIYNADDEYPPGSATLRSPYMALHHIIRIDSMSKSALVGDISVNDDGIINHDTIDAVEGDALVFGTYDGVPDKWRPLKLFDGYPADYDARSSFEGGFRIDATNNRIGIGTSSPSYDIEIKKNQSCRIRITDENDGTGNEMTRLDLQASGGSAYIRTVDDNHLYIGANQANQILLRHLNSASGRVDFLKTVRFDDTVDFQAGVEFFDNIKVSGGQVYSTAAIYDGSGIMTMNCNNGNVVVWTRNNSQFTLEGVSNHVAGGSYTLIIRNTSGSNRNIYFQSLADNDPSDIDMYFANNIAPSLILAGQQVVISMVSDGDNLYCTFADFDAPNS